VPICRKTSIPICRIVLYLSSKSLVLSAPSRLGRARAQEIHLAASGLAAFLSARCRESMRDEHEVTRAHLCAINLPRRGASGARTHARKPTRSPVTPGTSACSVTRDRRCAQRRHVYLEVHRHGCDTNQTARPTLQGHGARRVAANKDINGNSGSVWWPGNR
jgi:hypothetical protein